MKYLFNINLLLCQLLGQSPGGGGFIDIVDVNERLLVNPPLQEFMK
jgi:hypothetical protein